MQIKDARVNEVTIERDEVRGSYGRLMGHTAPDVTLTVRLPPGADQLLPADLMHRKVTIVIEPTPGEAAYLKHTEEQRKAASTYAGMSRVLSWEQLTGSDRNHWERVAEAAIKAK